MILKKHRCGYVHVKHSNSLNIDFSTTLGNPYAPLGHIKTINYHVSPVVIDILRDKRMFYFGDFNHSDVGSWGPEMDHPRRNKFEKNSHHKLWLMIKAQKEHLD